MSSLLVICSMYFSACAISQNFEVTRACIADGIDQKLGIIPRVFMYMPLMHSEDLKDQEHCVELFGKLWEKDNVSDNVTNEI
jgi:uncharacterized protein (DUF924 family)